MSGALGAAGRTVISVAGQALHASGTNLGALISGTIRKLDTIIPDVVVTEHHVDRLQVTQHPVADNTSVQDHAFMMPKTLTMQCGWSNSSLVAAGVQGFMGGEGVGPGGLIGAGEGLYSAFTEQRVKEVYNRLLDLQKQRRPFKITTGKRTYDSMLITELSVTTDRHSEYALIVSCSFQEIILVKTQTATAPGQQSQADAKKTTGTDDKGTVQLNSKDSPLVGGDIERLAKKYLPTGLISPGER